MVNTDPFDLVAGESVFSFSADKVKVVHNPTGGIFQLTVESPSLTVANVFGSEGWTRTGSNIEIDLNLGADFELALWDGSDDLSFGGFTLTGTDVWLIREDNVMKLSLRQRDGMLAPPPSQLKLPFNLGSFVIDTFEIASDGTFDLEILDPQIGPTVLHVSADKMHFRNTTGGFEGLELFVENPQLHLPLGVDLEGVDLDLSNFSFSFDNQGFASFDVNNLVREVFDFFGDFAPKADQQSMMGFKLATSGSGWEFYLEGDTGPQLKQPYGNGYAELKEFRVDSAGNITGKVRADLTVEAGGQYYTLARGDFQLEYDGSILKMSVPSLSTDLGFVTANMSGWIKSDGSYSLSHSAWIDQEVSVAGYDLVHITGTLYARLSSDEDFYVHVSNARLKVPDLSDGDGWVTLVGPVTTVEINQWGVGVLGGFSFELPSLP